MVCSRTRVCSTYLFIYYEADKCTYRLGITAGSLATLRPLLRKLTNKWKTRHDLEDSTGSTHTLDVIQSKSENHSGQRPLSRAKTISRERLRMDTPTSGLEVGVTKPPSVLQHNKGCWFPECDGEGLVDGEE